MDVRVLDTEENLDPITYICSECGKNVVLQPVAAVRCRNCGSRILYKNRSHKVVQYEAR